MKLTHVNAFRAAGLSLAAAVILLAPVLTQAETVSIDPPATPVEAGQTTLKTTITASPNKLGRGQNVTLSVTVKNTGSIDATNVGLEVMMPVGFTADTSSWSTLGTIAAGTSLKKTAVVTTSAAKEGRHVLEVVTSSPTAPSVETVTAIDIQAPQVLGASDVLAETGRSPLLLVIIGFLTALTGIIGGRRMVQSLS